MVYILAVVIGGFMLPGYNHIYNTISELTASNAPRIPLIQVLFTLHIILAGITSIFTMIAIIQAGVSFKNDKKNEEEFMTDLFQ